MYQEDTPKTVAVTFYYKDGAWDYENLWKLNLNVDMVYEKNGSQNQAVVPCRFQHPLGALVLKVLAGLDGIGVHCSGLYRRTEALRQ